MATPPRTPPRFVPTLTEVVQVPDAKPSSLTPPVPARTTVMAPHAVPPAVMSSSPAGRPMAAAPSPSTAAPLTAATQRLGTPAPVPSPTGTRVSTGAGASVSGAGPVAAVRSPVANSEPRAVPAARLADGTEEYVVHRVMQRVDVVLEKRLREAIASVVQEQTRSVLPRLREEIESVVRHAVYEAVADELASSATPRQ